MLSLMEIYEQLLKLILKKINSLLYLDHCVYFRRFLVVQYRKEVGICFVILCTVCRVTCFRQNQKYPLIGRSSILF